MTLQVDITHRFGDFALDIAFEAPPGVTVLFGRSGAGKSSVVQAVAGLLRPDQGRITLGDQVFCDSRTGAFLPPHRRRIGYVFQDARLFPHFSLSQNLSYGRWFNPAARHQPIGPVLDMLGLTRLMQRRIADLSGGEKARVALARALLSGPRMLLLDEPLAALDAARKAEILPYLERLRDELALPMLYVTHAPTEALRLATTLVLLEGGRVLASGPPETVFLDPGLGDVLGPGETGAVIRARFVGPEADGLLRWQTAAGPVLLPAGSRLGDLSPGQTVRLRVLAQDVMLATQPPEGLSALNILPGLVQELDRRQEAVTVRLDLGEGEGLLARITQRSAHHLGLEPGMQVYAIVKAMSLAKGMGSAAPVPEARIGGR